MAQAKTREEIAEAESLRGWGILLLRSSLYSLYNPKYTPLWKRLSKEAVINAVKKPTELFPDNAVHWQSLGDAYETLDREVSQEPPVWKARLHNAIDAYNRSLTLNKKQPSLAFHIYELQRSLTPEDSPRYLSYLHQAVRYDPTNFIYRATLFMEEIVEINKKKDLPPSELRNQVTRACKTIPSGPLNKPATQYQSAIPKLLVPARDLRGGRRQDPVGQMTTLTLSLMIAESAAGITGHLVESGSSSTALLLGSTLLKLGNYWLEIYSATEENGQAMPTLSLSNYSVLMDCGYKVQKRIAESSGDYQVIVAVEEARKRYKDDFQNRHKAYWRRNEAQFKDAYKPLF